jgi:amino acid permease
MNLYFVFASMMLAGTIIGAGIFSLPYVMSVVGFGSGILFLLGFFMVYAVIHNMFAHVLVEEKGTHELVHVVSKYLGVAWGRLASVTTLTELLLVLTAYLILAPSFISILFGTSHTLALLLFWAVSSFFIFSSLRTLGIVNTLSIVGVMSIVIVVYIMSLGSEGVVVWARSFSWGAYLLPFGPILFAMSGRPSIIRVVEEWRAAQRAHTPFSLFWAVTVGTLLPALIYLLFVWGVLRLTPSPTPDTLTGLREVLSPFVITLLGCMGLLAIGKSYFMIGADVRDIIHRDLRGSPLISTIVVLCVPLMLYMCGFNEFVTVIGFVGGVFLAIEGMLIIAVWRVRFPTHPMRTSAMILYGVFVVAIFYELVRVYIA